MTFVGAKSVTISAGSGGSAQTEQIPSTHDMAHLMYKFATWNHAHIVNTHASQTLTTSGTAVASSVIIAAGKEMVIALKHEGTLILTGSGASTTGVLTYGRIHG